MHISRIKGTTMALFGPAVFIVTSLLASSAANASASFDFLFSMDSVDSDKQFFLNMAVRDYGFDRRSLEPVLPRVRYVEDDLPVILFLSRESRRPVDFIVSLRSRGLRWSEIFSQVRVAPDVLFVGIDRDPGPPYGKAWGHWKKNARRVRLSDADIVGLTHLQVGHRIVGLSPYELARARGQGRRVEDLACEKHGRRRHASRSRRHDDHHDDHHDGHPGKRHKGHKHKK